MTKIYDKSGNLVPTNGLSPKEIEQLKLIYGNNSPSNTDFSLDEISIVDNAVRTTIQRLIDPESKVFEYVRQGLFDKIVPLTVSFIAASKTTITKEEFIGYIELFANRGSQGLYKDHLVNKTENSQFLIENLECMLSLVDDIPSQKKIHLEDYPGDLDILKNMISDFKSNGMDSLDKYSGMNLFEGADEDDQDDGFGEFQKATEADLPPEVADALRQLIPELANGSVSIDDIAQIRTIKLPINK